MCECTDQTTMAFSQERLIRYIDGSITLLQFKSKSSELESKSQSKKYGLKSDLSQGPDSSPATLEKGRDGITMYVSK